MPFIYQSSLRRFSRNSSDIDKSRTIDPKEREAASSSARVREWNEKKRDSVCGERERKGEVVERMLVYVLRSTVKVAE